MKKIVLIILLTLSSLNAKSFAYCTTNTIGNPHNVSCTGKNDEALKAKSVFDMYDKGWKLVSVNTTYLKYNSSYKTYFYFEK